MTANPQVSAGRVTAPSARPAEKITVTITAPGYNSGVDLPLGADAASAFCAWFEMQLAYLARWKPGMTTAITETTPLP